MKVLPIRSQSAFALFALMGLSAACPALARPVKAYASLRRATHCDRALSYAQVQKEAANFAGRVLELRGVVGGIAQVGSSCTIMLNLRDGNAPALELTKADFDVLRDSSTPALRVLVQVESGGGGNVVPLRVLAAAFECEVVQVDRQEDAQQASRARRVTASARTVRQRPAPVYASRGGYFRQSGPSNASASALAAYYQPLLGTRVRECFGAYFDYVMRQNPRLDAATAGKIAFHLLDFADKYDVDPRLIVAMIVNESGFDPGSTSHSGAMGLGQLMPGTAAGLGVRNGYDVEQNLGGSIAYLRSRLETFKDKAGGNWTELIRLAMAAYNAGAGAVRKYNGVPPYKETQHYVQRIEKLYRQLCSGDAP